MPNKGPHRKLAAILFTDIQGYTSLMQKDEQAALVAVHKHEDVLQKWVKENNGILHQFYGDGSLSYFESSSDAIACGLDIQKEFLKDPTVPVRVGIHIGEIYFEGNKIYGDGVNVASRIESIGQPGTVFISKSVFDQVQNLNRFQFESIGLFNFKNVTGSIEVFSLLDPELNKANKRKIEGKLTSSKRSISPQKIILFVVLFLCIALIGFWYQNAEVSIDFSSRDTQESIAVLPFKSLSEESQTDKDYFSDGIAEDILTQLSKVSELKVISHPSSWKYADSDKDYKTIGKELGVKSLLMGSVRKVNDRVRINVQLIDTENSSIILSERFDKEINNILDVQQDVALRVSEALKLTLSRESRNKLNQKLNVDPEAYEYFKLGQVYLFNQSGTRKELDSAVYYFNQSIEKDPEFAYAYVGLAEIYLDHLFWHRAPYDEIIPIAREAARTAMRLDNSLGEGYGVMGSIDLYSHHTKSAKKNLLKAIELTPNYSISYERLAWIYYFEDKIKEAHKLFDQAIELDPRSNKYTANKAFLFYLERDFQEAIDYIEAHMEKYPEDSNDNFLMWLKAVNLSMLGQYDEAISIFKSRSIGKSYNWMLGVTYANAGNTKAAREILEYNLEKSKTNYVPTIMLAAQMIALGDYEQGLEYLEKTVNNRSYSTLEWGMPKDPIWDDIRNDSRFQELSARMQF